MNDDSYYYVVDGQQRPLRRVDTARFVSPERDHHMAHVGARLAGSTRLSIDTGVSHDCLVVRGDPEKLEIVRSYTDVKANPSCFSRRRRPRNHPHR